MIAKIIVVAPTTAVPMSTGFAVALKVLPAPSFSSSSSLPRSKLGSKPKSRLTSSRMFGICSIVRQLVHRLRVVRHRAIAIDRDRDGAHAEEAECHQTEREDRRRHHEVAQPHRAHRIRDRHETHDRHA